jgi:hypothetical protein
MQRFNMLNNNSIVLGVGSGTEKILFYFANDLVKQRICDRPLYDERVG